MGEEESKNEILNSEKKFHGWRDWHEREVVVNVNGEVTEKGVKIKIDSKQLGTELNFVYPDFVWKDFIEENKVKFLDNVTYIFTAHLPFLLKGNIRLEYNTAYPQVYSWAHQCFMRFLPAYWYVYKGQRGTRIFPLLKTLLNSRAIFTQTEDVPPDFPVTTDKDVVIPFTFGKDSFLSYCVGKEIGLRPTLVYFNEPTEEYAGFHKQALIEEFKKETGETIHYMENPFGKLREYGDGWFGWELALTSWTLLCLPFAHNKKAGYIIFSNEASCDDFFYDEENFKVFPDYEQSTQATEELSLLTQALSEGEVYTTTFLKSLHDLAIISILNKRYNPMLKFLMSCWAENSLAAKRRWCHGCAKCARTYLYLVANGVDPKYVGFEDNMFNLDKKKLFNIFGQMDGTSYDSFGTNHDEQMFGFYLSYLRGNRDQLVKDFMALPLFKEAEDRFQELLFRYYVLQDEAVTPVQWKDKIDKIFSNVLKESREEIIKLNNKI